MGSTIINFLDSWKELIIAFFKEYPLAAAIITAIAIGAFILLEKKYRPGKTLTNLLITLAGWAILVPIAGLIFNIAGEVYKFLLAFLSIIVDLVGPLYNIYKQHTLMVLVIIGIGVITFFVWKWTRPKFYPRKWIRIGIIISSVVVVIFIAGPIADFFTPQNVPNSSVIENKDEKPKEENQKGQKKPGDNQSTSQILEIKQTNVIKDTLALRSDSNKIIPTKK